MQLSTKTTYSIRALADIAKHQEPAKCSIQTKNKKTPVLIKDIAGRQGIDIPYLEQLLNRLKKKGFLKAKRGPKGGYVLAKKPEEISLLDIVRAQGDKIAPVSCVEGSPCPMAKKCLSRETWQKMYQDIKKDLVTTKISDLIK